MPKKETTKVKFPLLFSPINISKLELKNRIVYPPMTSSGTKDGYVSDRQIDMNGEIAAGGVALMIIEDTMVQKVGMRSPSDPGLYDDSFMPSQRRLVQAIHKGGAKACLHLSHGGRVGGHPPGDEKVIPVAPSAIAPPSAGGATVPRELTVDEIEEIEDNYADAALRAKKVGYDVIGLHGAHAYLINQFLSPLSNEREDDYGGSFNRRQRFVLEVIAKIKKRIGDDFPILISLNGMELRRGGLTIEDTRQTARRLEAAGVHCIRLCIGDVPAYERESLDYIPLYSAAPMFDPLGHKVHLAFAVKDAVSIPVFSAGSIITPEFAEQILEQEKQDLIGIGRGLFADPEWPSKAQEGRENEIRHCIRCKWCSAGAQGRGLGSLISCAINPRFNRERETQITPAKKAKTVFVAGGGPGGLEAARVAALRGHKVTLYEKDKLGGQLNLSSVPPYKDEMKLVLDFEKVQMELLKVKIKHEELTADKVKRGKPDAVVVATGALPAWPDFPGSHNKNVVTYWQVLDGSVVPEGEVVVLGGRLIGAETAEYLASKGCQVTIVEESAEIARDALKEIITHYLRLSLKLLGVKMLTNTKCEKITKSGVTVNRKGERFSIPADTVVLALGNRANRELAEQLKNLDVERHVVGDCGGVGKMVKAIKEGFQAGLAL